MDREPPTQGRSLPGRRLRPLSTSAERHAGPLGALAFAAVAALSAALALREVWAADHWWQLATGRWVLEHGWPTVDVFSYTAAGRPWIEVRWLWCVLLAGINDGLGVAWLPVLTWLVVVAAFALAVGSFVREVGVPVTALVLAIGLLAASERLFARPELVTYVMLAGYAALIDRYRRRRTPVIWVLPAAQVVWTNAHTLFVFGPLIVGLAALLEVAAAVPLPSGLRRAFSTAEGAEARTKRKELPAVAVATAALTLVNPWGLAGALFPFQLFGEIRGESLFNRVVEEFQSPLAGEITAGIAFWIALAVLASVSALANLRRLDAFWLALTSAQLYLSFLAVRNIPLFALAAVAFVLSNVERAWPRASRSASFGRHVERSAVVAALLLSVGFGWAALTDRQYLVARGGARSGVGLAKHRFPFGALEWLDREGFEGRVLSTMREGSFLLAHGREVFIDPRLEVYGEDLLRRYVAVQQQPRELLAAVREYDVRALLVDLQSNVASMALELPDWALVHFDTAAALFVRRDALGSSEAIDSDAEIERALADLQQALPLPPPERSFFARATPAQPYLAVADFLAMLGRPALARPFLEAATAAVPDLEGLALRRATLAGLEGDWERASVEARAGLEREPDDERLVAKLAQALFRTGKLDEARSWLERAVEQRPDHAPTRVMLASVLASKQDFAAAAVHLERAVELEPQRADWLANLARVQARRGDLVAAIDGLERAAASLPQDVSIVRDLAVLLARSGQTERARPWIERGLALAPGDPILSSLNKAQP